MKTNHNSKTSKFAGTKRRFCETDLIDAVSDRYLNPRKRQRLSPIRARNQTENENETRNNRNDNTMIFELKRYSNSVEFDQSKQILQEMNNLEILTISDINHYHNKIKEKMNEIDEQKQC